MVALLAVPCPLVHLQSWQRHKWWCTTTMVVAAWMTVPWHRRLFLACLCEGVDGGSVVDGAQQR
jgi:hypothetical protein